LHHVLGRRGSASAQDVRHVLEKLEREVCRGRSAIERIVGSEPLLFTWDLALDLAAPARPQARLVTNLQFLDEKKFQELEPYVTYLRFSVDSHIREVYEKIRVRSRPDLVFRNLRVAASAVSRARHRGSGQRRVPGRERPRTSTTTVAFLADAGVATIRIFDYHRTHPARDVSDPALHLSSEWLDQMRDKIRAVARAKRVRVIFERLPLEVPRLPRAPSGRRPRPDDEAWLERLRAITPATACNPPRA
jgi:hypothetical protein